MILNSSAYVSSSVGVNVAIYRQAQTNSQPWLQNQCFEIYIKNPYSNPAEYQPFNNNQPPVCSSITDGIQMNCNIKANTNNTLQFMFTSISSVAQTLQSLRFSFSNFQLPYSSQPLTTIKMMSYSDAQCTSNMQTVIVSAITTAPVTLPSSSIVISSSSNQIGYSGSDNTLIVSFKPQTTMAPGGAGRIQIGIPYWFQVGTASQLMYDPEVLNSCYSSCMNVLSSILQSSYINILYNQMQPQCIKGTQITISCPGFFNPIYQGQWSGFYINIFDNQVVFKPIEQSDFSPYLDTTNYQPFPIPVDSYHFSVSPSDTTVSTNSQWTLILSPGLPMNKECYIKLYFPDDLQFTMQSIQATGMFVSPSKQAILSTNDMIITQPTINQPRQTITFNGCNDLQALGFSPVGRVDISNIRTQRGLFNSDEFNLEIYKDQDMTQLIAKLMDGAIVPASNILAGQLNSLAIYPLVYTVQISTLLFFKFTSAHDLYKNATQVVIILPSDLLLPAIGTQLEVIGLPTTSSGALASTDATQATVISQNTIKIPNFVQNYDRLAPYMFKFEVIGIANQISTKDAGSYNITTYYQDRTKQQFYMVDTVFVNSSFVAIPNTIDASGQILINNPTNYADNVTYTFIFTTPSFVPNGGYIQIDFPSDIVFVSSLTLQTGTCQLQNCQWIVVQKSLKVQTIQSYQKNSKITLLIGGIKNPRTMQPTASFKITSFDVDGVSLIDTGFNKNTATNIAAQIPIFSVQNQNQMNGAINNYTFKIISSIPILPKDVLVLTFPSQVILNAQNKLSTCTSSDIIVCSVSGNNLQITIQQLNSNLGFTWTMTNIQNPPSLMPSDNFSNIQILSAQGYLVSQYQSTGQSQITNLEPATLQRFSLNQQSLLAQQQTQYTITFSPINPLPITGVIQLTYPPQIQPSNGNSTTCLVTTNQQYQNNCQIDLIKRTIVINNTFTQAAPYSSQITIMLINMTNPIDNRAGVGFNLSTYYDSNMDYLQDTVTNILVPILQCDYPCSTCSNSRQNCTSCWRNSPPQIPNYLMLYYNTTTNGQCLFQCDFGFSSNGTVDRRCQQCDPSCIGCNDNGLVNDASQCLQCSSLSPFRLNATQKCVSICQSGLFLMSDSQTCGVCNKPCVSCFGGQDLCTSCDQNSSLPVLFKNQCVPSCPDGTTNIAGICQPCQSPCVTCSGSTRNCLSCGFGKNLLFKGQCYDTCPSGYATDLVNLNCIGCFPGCNLCQLSNTSICLTCQAPLSLFDGQCRGSCPNDTRPENGVCQYSNHFDVTLIYFPFLIAGVIFIFIVFFGKLKKKAILVNGKTKLVSFQNSSPAINAFIAPLQTLSTILQFVLAFYYGYMIHFVLALIVYLIQVIFNFSYLYWYLKSFYSKYIPQAGSIVMVKNKKILITKENANKHEQDRDEEFKIFVDKHKFSSYLIFSMIGGCHFKVSKLLYSNFYMFDSFKARWTRGTYLRKSMIKWQIGYLCAVDFTLIGISIFGLFEIKWNNQLFITMLESAILSIIIIILGVIERSQIDQIFAYTEKQKVFIQSDAMSKYLKKKKKLQNKISKSLISFKDRKLTELLLIFGGKHCKSMIDLRIDWEKEEDPRQEISWPISPQHQQKLMDLNIQFTVDDVYSQFNNVYTNAVVKPKNKDVNIQAGEPGRQEFQDALNRKKNEMLSQSNLDQTQDELFKIKTQRKRGRKNKYYNQIEVEDDIDVGEASEQETYLKLIQQQEEEEEALKQIINEHQIKAQERIQAKKLQKAQEIAKIKQEQAEKELKLKQELEAEILRQKQIAEAKRLQQEANERKKLEDEAARLQKEREMKEAEEMRLAIEASFQARREYEIQEANRIAAEQEKQRILNIQIEAQRIAQLERERLAKEEALKQQERAKQEDDERKRAEAKLLMQQQELLRQQEREAERALYEKQKQERHKREQVEKEVQQKEQEKRIEEARILKEQTKLKEQEEKQAKQEQRELERLRIAEENRIAREIRHQQEEIDRQGRQDQKMALKLAREQEELKAKGDIKKAAQSYARNLANQISDVPDEILPKPISTTQFETQNKQLAVQPNYAGLSQVALKKAETQKMSATVLANTISAKEDMKNNSNYIEVATKKRMNRSSTISSDIDVQSTLVAMNENVIKNFKQKETLITVPPSSFLRNFNEHDVLGELDRDEKGNIIVLEDRNGRKHDKKKNITNDRGYLIDPKTGEILENMSGQPMFLQKDLDEKGELPGPFCIEKHNFNPHTIMGDFDYTEGKPGILQTNQGFYVDKRGRRVNEKGWYILQNQPAHIVDKDQRKKFDRKQLVGQKLDDLPKLYNYSGKRFDIRDVMGEFDKDQYGNIQLHYTNNGRQLMDALGRLCNEKGYLTDGAGNIIDKNGRQIFKASDLKNGEFIKIFPFTKFNISKVQGEIEVSTQGNPILEKQPNGTYIDQRGRPVNIRGYLVDRQGNVIDIYGKLMFDKAVLDNDGEIPQVFRSGLLRQDTASSLSRLMSEIERNNINHSDFGVPALVNQIDKDGQQKDDGDTSVDSKMEDTPANYNMANQRYEQASQDVNGNYKTNILPLNEEDDYGFDQSDFSNNDIQDPAVLIPQKTQKNKRSKKKKSKITTIELLEPTSKQKNMAGAYGGEAKPEIRRPRIKYDKDRLENSKKFRIASDDEPLVKAQLAKLAQGGSKSLFPLDASYLKAGTNSNYKEDFDIKPEQRRIKRDSQEGQKQTYIKPRKSTIMQLDEPDFEQVYGKDIDQFLEDSEWDIDQLEMGRVRSESSDNMQHSMPLNQNSKVRGLEKQYLESSISQREVKINSGRKQKHNRSTSKSGDSPPNLNKSVSKKKIQGNKPILGPPRETIMSVTDDPQVIHRGEILEFETKKR